MDERTALDGSVAAIIPARGGSKSIPKKNLVNFGGQPLISYVIKAAKCCDRSTELSALLTAKKLPVCAEDMALKSLNANPR